jgi:hypothetical protein
MNPMLMTFWKPEREEWRLPDQLNPETGDMQVVRHNPDGPAVTTPMGYKAWYVDGLRHRVGGPAIDFDGFTAWYENGKAHRVDGPAKEFSDGSKQWWENGVRIK